MSNASRFLDERMKYLTYAIVLAPLWGCTPKPSPYDRLCTIYGDYNKKPEDPMIAVQIYDRVKNEASEILPLYDVLVQNGEDRRYNMLLEHARKDMNQPNWKCNAIRIHWPPGPE